MLIRTLQNNVAHQKLKSVQIVNAEKLPETKSKHTSKKKRPLPVYYEKCDFPTTSKYFTSFLGLSKGVYTDKPGSARLH